MGTMLDIEDFIKQWKTLVVAVLAMFGIGLMLFTVGPMIVDRVYAIAAAPPLPKDLQTTYMLLLKLAICAFLATKLSALTNGLVHTYVWCLFIGVLGRFIGFLELNAMTQANAFGLGMTALMAVIFAPLANATPEVLQTILFPLVVTLILGTIGIVILSTVAAKIFKMSVPMAIAIGTTALFGFPGTYILSNEVANANGKTDEERKKILDEILPRMLVAGFATVTVGSVIMAGVMVKML